MNINQEQTVQENTGITVTDIERFITSYVFLPEDDTNDDFIEYIMDNREENTKEAAEELWNCLDKGIKPTNKVLSNVYIEAKRVLKPTK